jgi:hypothetical protein
MSGITLFLVAVIAIALIAIAFFVKRPAKYFKTGEGKGVLFGIAAAIGACTLIALFAFSLKSEALEYFKSGEVYLGLDATNKMSPMCYAGENSDRLTSNLGLRVSLVSSEDGQGSINAKYTHHSCAFNADNRAYDALGLEAVYKIW